MKTSVLHHLKRHCVVAAVGLAALLAAPASAVTLVNDSFTDGDRINQSLPNSVEWFGGSATTTLTVTNNALVLPSVTDAKTSGAIGFFTEDGSPQTLGVGDSLKLSFTITTPTGALTGDNTFWYGLLDSTDGSRPTVDGSFDNGRYNAYKGYLATSPMTGASASRNRIVQRISGANNLTNTGFTSAIGANGTTPNLPVEGTYTFSLLLVRDSDTQITLTSDMGGVQLIRIDDATDDHPLLTAFDSVFIWTSNNNPATTIDNILVEYTSVPEPAAVGVVGAGLAGLLLRRNRRPALTC